MKNVISVDSLIETITKAVQTRTIVDGRNQRAKDAKVVIAESKKLLHSLLISKLPEKHVCTDECKINSNEWRIGHRAYKDAESNCIDDMHRVIDELFGVGDE